MTTEKFTKERFSKDEILFDLLAVEQEENRHGGEAYLYAILPCTLLAVLVGALLHNVWLASVLAAVAIFSIVRMIPLALRSRIMRRTLKEAIENDDFSITEERLHSIEEQKESARRSAKTVSLFHFESGASWQMPRLSEHYAWSEVCNMSSDGLDHTSLVGDEFYLVTPKALPHITYIYNKKLFEYEK